MNESFESFETNRRKMRSNKIDIGYICTYMNVIIFLYILDTYILV